MENLRLKNNVKNILIIISFTILWQIASMIVNNPLFLPSATTVIMNFVNSFIKPIGQHTMSMHILYSLYRVGVAFAFSTILGVLLGVVMGYSKTLEAILYPLFEVIRPIPPLAWIPMSILWFGLGDMSKFFIIFLGSFAFITLNTYEGTKSIDTELIGAAKMLGASDSQIFFKVVLPSTVPDIFAGLQIGVTSAWSAVVGAEMVQSDQGVGWLIVMGMNKGDTVQIMTGMVAIGLIGFLLAQLTTYIEGRLLVWNK